MTLKLTTVQKILILSGLALSSCTQQDSIMYKSDKYTIYTDRVEQGEFTALASGSFEMKSDYRSHSTIIDPVIQFKFSINGRDNELAFGINHLANILPSGDGVTLLEMTFGERSDLGSWKDASKPLPPNTRVMFRVDFNQVLIAFRENGFYDDILGNRIFAADFKGLYLAGDTYPLNWDFENIPANPLLKMEDPDGDGIFEKELIFNIYDPSAHTSSTWKLTNNISKYPEYESPFVLLNALHNMALDEMVMLMEEDGTFRTGEAWPGVWTRDLSYAAVLSLAYLDPDRCINSLMTKVSNDRIIQDTGTGGAWPVSSDRVVWSLAAWEIYKYTGDREWLEKAFEIVRNSLDDDSKTIIDPSTGLIRGESSFLDWRKQTYPLWMEPADIFGSLNLGTNAAYFQALKIAGLMALELDREDLWSERAEMLRENINNRLWLEDKGYYGQYLYGGGNRSLSPRSEALGEAFAVLFNIAGDERKQKVLMNTPVTPFGITCIYPQIPGIPPYHNNGIWPFVQAFWTLANAENKHTEAVAAGLASIIRPAALFLTNKENFVAENGDFAGTEVNSDRQLWSVAAMLAMHHRVLMGISFEKGRMEFNPVIPESFRGTHSLTNFRYRNGTYNISVAGWGDSISSFEIDGEELPDNFIPATMTGNHTVEIIMNGKTVGRDYNKSDNYTAPETPILEAGNNTITWNSVKGATAYRVFRNGEMISSITDTAHTITVRDMPDEYQVMAVDCSEVESFLSNPLTVTPPDAMIKIEAEDFNLPEENRVPGFTGKGYVRVSHIDPEDLIIKFKADAGKYLLRTRYANGTGPVNTDNNCGIRSLYVNGTFTCSVVFPQRGKDEWSDWGYTYPEPVELSDGENILVIRYEDFNRNMDGQVNEFLLDQVLLEKNH